MRIAISGTHCMGKTTLINDFIKVHPEYAYEPEPYYQLQELHGFEFSEMPTLEEFEKQLDYSIGRLHELSNQDNVIFERCPLDLLAYTMAHEELDDIVVIDKLPEINEALGMLDLIVFLPITPEHEVFCHASEDLELRKAVDEYLKGIYRNHSLDIIPYDLEVIEIWGSPQERIRKLELYLP